MYERFTDRAREVMQLANREARRFHHEYLGTEHILLGLIKQGTGTGANVLQNLGVDLRNIRLEVEKMVAAGADSVHTAKLPQTPRAKTVIEYAIQESRSLSHTYVGTEHILLGLARESEGVAARVLVNLGVTLEDVRREVRILLGHDPDEQVPPSEKPPRGPTSKENPMLSFWAGSSGIEGDEGSRELMGPGVVDGQLRQAIWFCWMMLPKQKRSIAAVESEIRRILDRALANLKEDATVFGVAADEDPQP